MFNKSTMKVPPRIEKWAMEMQDIDFKFIYKPGRDEQDLLYYLCTYPVPETGNDNTKRIIKWTIEVEHAIVLTKIREVTLKDKMSKKLAKRTARGDLEKCFKETRSYNHTTRSTRNSQLQKNQCSKERGSLFPKHHRERLSKSVTNLDT